MEVEKIASVNAGGQGQDKKLLQLVAAFALLVLCISFFIKLEAGDRANAHRLGDMFALWSYGHLSWTVPAGELYDMARLHAAQVAIGMSPEMDVPFPYPPTALPVFALLGVFDVASAAVIWTVVGLLAYLLTTSAGLSPKALLIPIALVVPSTSICLLYGQTGFIQAALIVGGIRLLDRHPGWAGIAFGLLAFKPQLALFVPILLLSRRDWRAFIAASLTVVIIAAVATLIWGLQAWADWLACLPAYRSWYEAVSLPLSQPSLMSNMTMLGLPRSVVVLIAGVMAMVGIGLVWWAGRHLPTIPAGLVVVCATFLSVPHSRVYELPVLTAMLLVYAASRAAANQPVNYPVVTAGLVLAALMMSSPVIPVSAAILAACIVMVWKDSGASTFPSLTLGARST